MSVICAIGVMLAFGCLIIAPILEILETRRRRQQEMKFLGQRLSESARRLREAIENNGP